jgi:hypothetical protein
MREWWRLPGCGQRRSEMGAVAGERDRSGGLAGDRVERKRRCGCGAASGREEVAGGWVEGGMAGGLGLQGELGVGCGLAGAAMEEESWTEMERSFGRGRMGSTG